MAKVNSYLKENIEKILIMTIIIFVPFRLLLSEYFGIYIKILPDFLISILFIIFFIRNKKNNKFILPDFLLFMFLSIAFISTIIVNGLPLQNFLYQTRALTLYYILFFVVRNSNYDKSFFQNISNLLNIELFLLFFFVSIEKIFYKRIFFPTEWTYYYSASNYSRVYSFLNDPNSYGAFSVFVYLYYLIISKKEMINKTVWLSLIVFCSVLLSASVSSTIILVIGLLLIIIRLFIYHKNKKEINYFKSLISKILFGFIFGVILFNLTLFLSENYEDYLKKNNIGRPIQSNIVDIEKNVDNIKKNENANNINKDDASKINYKVNNIFLRRILAPFTKNYYLSSSEGGRIYSISKSLEVFKDHKVWGSGFGTFGTSASKLLPGKPLIYDKYELPKGFYADNQYITILAETGLLGIIFFALFLISILYKYRKNYIKIIFCIIFGFLGFIYNVFEIQIIAMIFWLFLAVPDYQKKDNKKNSKSNNLWIDITNSPHTILFNPIIMKLKDKGYNITITARDYAQTLGLLDMFEIKYTLIGDHKGKNKFKKIWGLFQRSNQLYWFARNKNFDASLSMSSQTCMIASKFLGIPHMTLYDYEYTAGHHIDFRLSKQILTPEGVEEKTLKKYGANLENVIYYPGLKEQFYIYYYMDLFNQKYVNENPIKKQFGIDKNRILIVIRPEATAAHYQSNENQLSFSLVEYLSKHILKPIIIILPRLSSQKEDYKKRNYDNVIIPNEVINGIELVACADLVIGAGGTVNREAASIGTPAYSIYQGGVFGAVDRMLVDTKRMIHINSEEDFSKIKIELKIDKPKPVGKDFSEMYIKLVERLISSKK